MKPSKASVTQWLHIAGSWPVVRRALFYAVVVGAILIGINHGDVIACGAFSSVCLAKMALTPLVPYVVSTLSSVQAILGQTGDR